MEFARRRAIFPVRVRPSVIVPADLHRTRHAHVEDARESSRHAAPRRRRHAGRRGASWRVPGSRLSRSIDHAGISSPVPDPVIANGTPWGVSTALRVQPESSHATATARAGGLHRGVDRSHEALPDSPEAVIPDGTGMPTDAKADCPAPRSTPSGHFLRLRHLPLTPTGCGVGRTRGWPVSPRRDAGRSGAPPPGCRFPRRAKRFPLQTCSGVVTDRATIRIRHHVGNP